MANTTTTVLQQILHFMPADQFESFVGQHRADRYVKKLTCWNQLTILLYAQASGNDSLRESKQGLLLLEIAGITSALKQRRNQRWPGQMENGPTKSMNRSSMKS